MTNKNKTDFDCDVSSIGDKNLLDRYIMPFFHLGVKRYGVRRGENVILLKYGRRGAKGKNKLESSIKILLKI